MLFGWARPGSSPKLFLLLLMCQRGVIKLKFKGSDFVTQKKDWLVYFFSEEDRTCQKQIETLDFPLCTTTRFE